MGEKCLDCKFSLAIEGGLECIRMPPIKTTGESRSFVIPIYVDQNQWCGEYKEKPKQ